MTVGTREGHISENLSRPRPRHRPFAFQASVFHVQRFGPFPALHQHRPPGFLPLSLHVTLVWPGQLLSLREVLSHVAETLHGCDVKQLGVRPVSRGCSSNFLDWPPAAGPGAVLLSRETLWETRVGGRGQGGVPCPATFSSERVTLTPPARCPTAPSGQHGRRPPGLSTQRMRSA